MISLLAFCRYSSANNSRGRPSICLAKHRTRILLPTRTRFVTPGSTELHFYSDRHVRDRVRLHLRRVTENNNRERRTRPTTTERNLRGSARHEQSRTLPRCDEESRRGAGPRESRRLPRRTSRVSKHTVAHAWGGDVRRLGECSKLTRQRLSLLCYCSDAI